MQEYYFIIIRQLPITIFYNDLAAAIVLECRFAIQSGMAMILFFED